MTKSATNEPENILFLGIDIDDTIADWEETPPYSAKPSLRSQEVLTDWVNEGWVKIVYITSRPRSRSQETTDWLIRYRYPQPHNVLYEEDIKGGKPSTLNKLGAHGLVDDMPNTQKVACREGLYALWRDIPKNNRFPRPPEHPQLLPWKTWDELDRLVHQLVKDFVQG